MLFPYFNQDFSNVCQRVCVLLVALARTKLVKEYKPEENPQDFPCRHRPSN